ncbi:hypothetical protein [Thiohalomonas denitrificans]|uniref:hypothetical protein n=1 Tax=Thiohalomonas denitrificans TaxID=415747 RepID=UPI0026EF7012|nr:hypothetical protein [Thiohalomonas denitrificans]
MKPDGWTRTALIGVLAALVSACEFDLYMGTSGSTDTEPSDWWKCPELLDGSWAFGRVPYGCDVEEFGSTRVVRSDYRAYIFDDEEPRDGERIRYMGELYPFLADEAAAYIRSRRPEVSDLEVENWQHAVYTTAHQETFWTHYREASTYRGRLLTMVRGDAGHGHGLMQIDDRYHTDAIGSGKGWRLDDNLIYALDIYYEGWQRAPGEWCVGSADQWMARARSAYSAYNGGPGEICRWMDSTHTWARNDEGFYDKYTGKEWEYYAFK